MHTHMNSSSCTMIACSALYWWCMCCVMSSTRFCVFSRLAACRVGDAMRGNEKQCSAVVGCAGFRSRGGRCKERGVGGWGVGFFLFDLFCGPIPDESDRRSHGRQILPTVALYAQTQQERMDPRITSWPVLLKLKIKNLYYLTWKFAKDREIPFKSIYSHP